MLRKRQPQPQINSPSSTRRPPTNSIMQNSLGLSDLQDLFEWISNQSQPDIPKQLTKYLNTHRLSKEDISSIFQFLLSHNTFPLDILTTLDLSIPQLTKLTNSSIPLNTLSLIVLASTTNPSLAAQETCQLIRSHLLDHYLTSTPVRTTPVSIKLLFYLIKHDPNRQQLIAVFTSHFSSYLQSSELNVPTLFEEALVIPQLHDCLGAFIIKILNKQARISIVFQQYIVRNIILITEKFPEIQRDWIFEFICFKMKSLDREIRHSANEAVLRFPATKEMVELLINKDIFGANELHKRGALLQVLEDEYKDIRMGAIQCLENFLGSLNMGEVKQIILYMINDQSDQVRGAALQALTVVSQQYNVSKQELEIIFTPLKEKSRLLRHLCYKVMEILSVQNQKMFIQFVQKLFKCYDGSKQDKRFLYNVMRRLGKKYSTFIINNLSEFIDLQPRQEPSWKSFIHKAKIILISNAFAPRYSQGIIEHQQVLPPYFLNHYEYIKDMEPYAFEERQPPSYLSASKVFNHNMEKEHLFYGQIMRSERVFIKSLPGGESTSKERFLNILLEISQSIFTLEQYLKSGRVEGMVYVEIPTQILLSIAELRSRFEGFQIPILQVITLVAFQYFMMGKLTPLQFDREQIQPLTRLNASVLSSFSQFPPTQPWGDSISKLISWNEEASAAFNPSTLLIEKIKGILKQHLLFESLFKQLHQFDNIQFVEPKFDIQLDSSLSKIFRQYVLNIEVTDLQSSIQKYRFRVVTQSEARFIRINGTDSAEQELPSENKSIYSIPFHTGEKEGYIQRVDYLKEIRMFQGIDKQVEERVRKAMGIDKQFIVLQSIQV